MLGRRIAARPRPPATVRDLEIALLEEWNSIPQSLIDNLIASMVNSCWLNSLPSSTCYLTTLDLNTLSNLNIPFIFLELIGNKRELTFPKKTPKKVSGKVPYRFVTNPSKKKTGFIRRSQTA
ncbi:hypothetical protein TNCV_372341 [Trichonephila clavipes]|nr:hypothetical protein TNCV_372341 [Trichonephila clavipes]